MASKTLVVRIGYAAAASGPHGSYVVYAEAPLPPLPPSRRFPQSANSPISQLDLAIYLGRSQTSAALLVTNSTASLPLSGTTLTSTIPFGNTALTLMTVPRSVLSGTVSRYLPLAIALGGLLITALAALLTERLIRRRQSAERLTGGSSSAGAKAWTLASSGFRERQHGIPRRSRSCWTASSPNSPRIHRTMTSH